MTSRSARVLQERAHRRIEAAQPEDWVLATSTWQAATTLSGGEAHASTRDRAKPSRDRPDALILDSQDGLHFADVERLSKFFTLVDAGNTVVVIEHNLDVVKTADHVIDLGPEGGKAGGEVIAEGTPEAVARARRSFTGRYLRDLLATGEVRGIA